jgi:hypothetical protein
MRALLVLALLMVPAAAGGATNAPGHESGLPPEFFIADAPTVINKVILAYGGVGGINESGTVFARGRVFDVADERYHVYTHYVAPMNRLRINISLDGKTTLQLLNGIMAYRGVVGLTRYRLWGSAVEELKFEYQSLMLPRLLASGSYGAEFIGTASTEGHIVYALRIKPGYGPPMDVYVDAKTGLIVKTSAKIPDEEWGEIGVEHHYSSYSRFGNTSLPKDIVRYRDGVPIERVEIFGYEINPSISRSLFE